MGELNYLNFDLQFERGQEGYRARVVASPLDRACCSEFGLPPEELRLPLRAGLEEIRAFGTRLFRAVFDDEIYSHLRLSQDEAERKGADGLRIRLLLTDVPELADLPWEYLYDPARDQFLSLSTKTPVVRYLDISQRVQPLAVKPPLRVLVVISSPRDQPPLDADQEWNRLNQALQGLVGEGRIELELLEEATLPALQTRLRRGNFQIFHYVGHGGFDQRTGDGMLMLEGATGMSQAVSGKVLGSLLHNEATLRLALLNACEGTHGSETDPFSGTAQSLVRKEIPAVIAMQEAISDEAAKTFAYEFYRALADDYPVDKALTEARMAIFLQGNEREWGTPVLFMRASDARLEAEAVPATAALAAGVAEKPAGFLRRTLRLGPLPVPVVVLWALPLLLLALIPLGVVLLGPVQMEGRFNVAVAQVGVLAEDGKMVRSDDGQLITDWIVEGFAQAEKQSEDGGITIWHDGMPLTEKRSTLGMIAGQTARDRADAAADLAERVNAHVLVYGHIDDKADPPELVLEFYVAPRVRVESAATIGRYQLGDPLPIPEGLTTDLLAEESLAGRVIDRSELLFWLLLSLRDDLLGHPEEALATLRRAETELGRLREQGDGKEHLYYLKGRSALFLDFYDEAEAALQKAIASNPTYARAQIALGSVYLDRAQTLQTPEERAQDPTDLEQAIQSYEKALELARAENDPLNEVIAHLGLAGAYRLEAETWKSISQPDLDRAAQRYQQAIRELRLVIEPLEQAEQVRLLAQAYATLGAAHTQLAQLLQIQDDLPASLGEYEAARTAFAGCIAQGDRAPEDEVLQTEIIGNDEKGCQHWDRIVDEILQGLQGG